VCSSDLQTRLASLLNGILCQVLVPTKDLKARVPAVEVMLANPAVKNLIREGKIHQLPNTIRTHSQMGMQLLDNSLLNLYQRGQITGETLLSNCNDPAEISKILSDGNPSGPSTPQPPVYANSTSK
jgi:twitching motility protein PilT